MYKSIVLCMVTVCVCLVFTLGCDLPPENESTTELRILLEFGFIKGETQWDENVIPPSRSYRNFGLPR